MTKLSAVVCTYRGDEKTELEMSVRSLLNQTRPPDEILVVEDGPLTDGLSTTLSEMQQHSDVHIRRVSFPQNRGHGAARRKAITEAEYELVAIQDADDIAVPQRFEWSLEKLKSTEADLVGGYIEEFSDDPDHPHAVREVPCDPTEIEDMAKLRSPINHTTVLARRSAILDAGNYRPVGQMEDYELWARMIVNGSTLTNIPRVLAKVRAGRDMYRRRGGIETIREELRLQRHFAEIGFISPQRAVLNLVIRSVPKLLPNKARQAMYESLFRERAVADK